MDKFIKLMMAAVLSMIIGCCTTAKVIKAADISDAGGVKTTISTDKDSFSSSDEIIFSYEIQNSNSLTVNGLSWNLKLPEGIKIKTGALSDSDISLKSGQRISGDLILTASEINASSGSSQTASAGSKTESNSPKTGENSHIYLLLIIAGAAVLLLILTRKRKDKMSCLICLVFTASVICSSADGIIHAEGNSVITTSAEKTIIISDRDYTIKFEVSFDPDEETEEPQKTDPNTPAADGETDSDADGLTDSEEAVYNTNPYDADTDKDGYPDGYEVKNYKNPLTADSIFIYSEIAAAKTDYAEYDLEILNANEDYPLELFYNDDGKIKRINGIYTTGKIQNAQDALYSLYNIKTLLGIKDPFTELKYSRSVINKWTNNYSFTQIYNGIEAEGRTITVTCLKDGTVSSLSSSYLLPEKLAGVNTTPGINENDLENIINKGKEQKSKIKEYKLCIRTDPSPALVYIISNTSNETIIIDAHTGNEILRTSNIMNYSSSSNGTDELGNSQDFPVWTEDDKILYMYDDTREIYIFKDNNIIGFDNSNPSAYNIPTDPQIEETVSRNIKDKKSTWDATAVSGYTTFIQAYDRYKEKEIYGLNGNYDPSIIITNKDWGSYNAGFLETPDRIEITLGETNEEGVYVTHASKLSSIGHEFGHSVFQNGTGIHNHIIVGNPFMITVNEGYADIFGSWTQKEWMSSENGDQRNIPNPVKTSNPVKIDGAYYDSSFNEEHKNSTIISYCAYLLNTVYGFDMDELFDIYYNSLPSLNNSMSDFSEIRDAVVSSARSLRYSFNRIVDIYNAFERVGVEIPSGSAQITVKEGSVLKENAAVYITNAKHSYVGYTDANGITTITDIQTGTYTLGVKADGHKTIYSTIMIKENIKASRTIDLLTAQTDYEWRIFDHENFEQLIGPTLDHHIEINGSDIMMTGYTEKNFKDFLLTDQGYIVPPSYSVKILSFNLKRDSETDSPHYTSWHTMEGGGFLFDVDITDNRMTCYCILVTPQGLRLFYLENIDVDLFRNGESGDFITVGKQIGEEYYPIGNVFNAHNISVTISKGTGENISVYDNGTMIIDKLEVPRLNGEDYGPVTSHYDHCCEQVSFFTFSDIVMSKVC